MRTEEVNGEDPFADDPLVKRAREGIAVGNELTGSPIWMAILESAQADELQAMRELADTAATDIDAIIACKIRIFAARAVPGYVLAKIDHGQSAEREIEAQDEGEADDSDSEDWPR